MDGAVVYECPCTGEIYVLTVRNALYIPHLQNNLIPPFLMRAAEVTLNETPKIHSKDQTIDDHCITFEDSDLRIPLQLSGVFESYSVVVYCWIFAMSLWGIIKSDSGSSHYKWGNKIISQVWYI